MTYFRMGWWRMIFGYFRVKQHSNLLIPMWLLGAHDPINDPNDPDED